MASKVFSRLRVGAIWAAVVALAALACLVATCALLPETLPPGASPIKLTPPPEHSPSPLPVRVPPGDKIDAILKAADAAEPRPHHVPPPPRRLEAITRVYQDLSWKGLLINQANDPGAPFRTDAAATQAVPDLGALLQAVSLARAEDDLLNPEYPWGDQALAAGGLLAYTDQPVWVDGASQPTEMPAGNHLALLYRRDGILTFELRNEEGAVVLMGPWQLRSLLPPKDPTAQTPFDPEQPPRSFIAPNQICFSQGVYQACLNVRTAAVGHPASREQICEAVEGLNKADLLPSDAIVFSDTALAAVVSANAVEQCAAALNENDPTNCKPDLVIAAAEPYPADRLQMEVIQEAAAVHGLARTTAAVSWQPTVTITETAAPIAVMRVLQPLPGDVFDWDGNPMDLAPGDYRIDLLWVHHQGRWLTQFMWLEGGLNRYAYAPAEELTSLGEPVAGQDQPTPCEVVQGSFIVRPCRSGWGSSCTAFWCSSGCGKRDYCINRGRWC